MIAFSAHHLLIAESIQFSVLNHTVLVLLLLLSPRNTVPPVPLNLPTYACMCADTLSSIRSAFSLCCGKALPACNCKCKCTILTSHIHVCMRSARRDVLYSTWHSMTAEPPGPEYGANVNVTRGCSGVRSRSLVQLGHWPLLRFHRPPVCNRLC